MNDQTTGDDARKVTVPAFVAGKGSGERLAMLTAYDRPTAVMLDESGVDGLLVGDSVGMVALGYATTLPVTLDEMVHHAAAVARGGTRALRVVDMPYLSYQVSPERALAAAGRLVKEGGAEAVKVEGGAPVAASVQRLVEAGIPVMGHLGLTPQHVHRFGGYRVQGRDPEAAARLLDDAQALQDAGAFSVVLECIPADLARRVTERLEVPTIGIGAGAECDGQVLVVNDMLGLSGEFRPRFVKRYADLETEIRGAVAAYVDDVRTGRFPGPEHAFDGD